MRRKTWPQIGGMITCAGAAMIAAFAPAAALGYILPAESILASMARRRADIAFSTIVAQGSYQKGDGPVLAVWEALKEGKAHRIERKSPAGSDVILTVPGKQWTFKLGEKAAAPARHPGDLVFTFLGTADKDSGGQRAVAFLEQRGIDVGTVSLSRLEGRVCYVIGAKPWETSKPQMWIDKERLVPMRLIELDKASGKIVDTRLLGIGSAITREWFPQRIEVWRDGKLDESTTYKSARINEEVSDDLFRAPT